VLGYCAGAIADKSIDQSDRSTKGAAFYEVRLRNIGGHENVRLAVPGGGVGQIGMWKAFEELELLGWIGSKRPKMIAVQAAGCQPIVRAFERQADSSEPWLAAHTVASGLRVPKALGDFLVLDSIRKSGGTAIAISDEEMMESALLLSQSEGVFPAPEGGACVAAAKRLLRSGFLSASEQIVIFNTGSGLKYLEAYATRFSRQTATEEDKLGGLITAR
jgi:threonine synthase